VLSADVVHAAQTPRIASAGVLFPGAAFYGAPLLAYERTGQQTARATA